VSINYIFISGLAHELKGELAGKTIEFRAELFMTLEQFKKTNKQRTADSEKEYQNPRNAIAGIINSKFDKLLLAKNAETKKENESQNSLFEISENIINPEKGEYKSYATLLCYSYIANFEFDISNSKNCGLLDVLSTTREILNRKSPYFNEDELLADIELYGSKIIRDNKHGKFIPSAIGQMFTDGIVIKCVNDKKISEKLGFTEHHPNSQIAYKYMTDEDRATTQVENIEMSVGRTGRVSIRAKLSPAVNLYGSNIEYATLHSFDWLQKKDVRIGSRVAVIKANDVIPYIAAVLENPKDSIPYEAPSLCPLCSTPLDKTTRFLRCENNLCPSRGVTALETAVGKSYLDIDSLSKKTLEAAYNAGLIHDIADIFNLTIDNLKTLPTNSTYDSDSGAYQKETLFEKEWSPETSAAYHEAGQAIPLGQTVATTIFNSIQQSKNIPFDRLLASLNIPLLGKKLGKSLVKKFGTMDNLLNATKEQLEEIDLVSSRKSEEIIKGLKLREPLIKKLKAAGVNMGIAAENNLEQISDKYEGQNIVVSGSIPGYSREVIGEIIESHGGNLVSNVSSKTAFLVANPDANSSKTIAAKKSGIPIIPPKEFLKEIGLS
jgi:DNA ligase (NAD+)